MVVPTFLLRGGRTRHLLEILCLVACIAAILTSTRKRISYTDVSIYLIENQIVGGYISNNRTTEPNQQNQKNVIVDHNNADASASSLSSSRITVDERGSVKRKQQQQQQQQQQRDQVEQVGGGTTQQQDNNGGVDSVAGDGIGGSGSTTTTTTTSSYRSPLPEDLLKSLPSSSLLLSHTTTDDEENNKKKVRIKKMMPSSLKNSGGEKNNNERIQLPKPLRVLEQYKRWHSVDALAEEAQDDDADQNNKNREYVVGLYACPVSAGNRMHEIINDLLYAIMMNRTLMWKYYDTRDCKTIKKHQRNFAESKMCGAWNTVEDCDKMMARAPWIPSWKEWSTKLGLRGISSTNTTNGRPYFAAGLTMENYLNKTSTASSYYPTVMTLPRNDRSMEFGVGRRNFTTSWRTLPAGSYAQQVAGDLFSLGKPFFYGAAFRYLFDFTDDIIKAATSPSLLSSSSSLPYLTTINNKSQQPYSIALHSRHAIGGDLGCNVTNEWNCIQSLLSNASSTTLPTNNTTDATNPPCSVWIMSDRECTLRELQKLLNGTCDAHVADHEGSSNVTGHGEHGPFAGVGFFKDLAAASTHARNGVVGSHHLSGNLRSSSAMLFALITFNKKMERWLLDGETITEIDNPGLCKIPSPSPGTVEKMKIREKKKGLLVEQMNSTQAVDTQ